MRPQESAPLTVDDLDLLCDRFRSGTPVRATTPHGSYTFDVVAVEQDEQGRVLLRLSDAEPSHGQKIGYARKHGHLWDDPCTSMCPSARSEVDG
jgi:hypothetical protein